MSDVTFSTEEPTLYLVATPIGNLSDISERAIETLRAVDLIAAEDTRNSVKLLNRFDVHTPMTSYHEFNRFDKAEELVELMKTGKSVACITDAGTPGISDPGEVLVQKAVDAGICVVSVPGPSAFVSALIVSGLSTKRFRFEGFLPTEKKERGEILSSVQNDSATLIFYEAPHRLKKTLSALLQALGDRKIAVVRELTKLHEETMRTTLSEAVRHYENAEPRGEYVLVVAGKPAAETEAEEAKRWKDVPIADHVKRYEAEGLDRKSAMKRVAEDRKISKRDVYQALLPDENE